MLFAVLALLALLQTPSQIPAAASRHFEVASVKLNAPDGRSGVQGDCHGADSNFAVGDIGATIPRGRCVITAARLSHLIAIAYHLPIPRISGGPEFVWGVERYDIAATSNEASATHEQLLEMLRNLMAERFKLKFHVETKDVSGHAVILAKNGPKLKPSKSTKRASARIMGAAINKFDAVDGKNTNLNTLMVEGMTIPEFVSLLADLPGVGPLVDKTGISGIYDITLSWEPTESISSAMQEQLGLRLDAQKVPLDYFVIDSAAKPSEN